MLKDVITWTKLAVIICTLLACPALAYRLDETINVTGGGDLSVASDIPHAHDFAQGIGSQTYHRVLSSDNSDSSDFNSNLSSEYEFTASSGVSRWSPLYEFGLESKYENLTKVYENTKNNYNQYAIRMDDVRKGLAYSVSASGLESLKSKSKIGDFEQNLVTQYDIKGQGLLGEIVSSHKELKHIRIVASSQVYGNFVLKSTLAENTPENDYQRLMGKLNSSTQAMLAEAGLQNESAKGLPGSRNILGPNVNASRGTPTQLQTKHNQGGVQPQAGNAVASNATTIHNQGAVLPQAGKS
jgi:hypothetical protein